MKEANAYVKDRAAHYVQVFIAGLVQRAKDGRHHRGRHARRPQALVAVTQRDIDQSKAPLGDRGFVVHFGLHMLHMVRRIARAQAAPSRQYCWRDLQYVII